MLYGKGTKNLRFRTLNGKIKFGINDLETKYEALLKLEQIARKEDALGDDEEQMLADISPNLNLIKKKELKIQDQLANDIKANKGKPVPETTNEHEEAEEDKNTERKPAIEQALTPEEEMALERFKDYEKRLVIL